MFLDILKGKLQLDAPTPWGLFFQDSASPQMEGVEELHNNIMFYLAIILFTVTWMMITIIRNFVASKSPIAHKYMNHGRCVPIHKYSKLNFKFKFFPYIKSNNPQAVSLYISNPVSINYLSSRTYSTLPDNYSDNENNNNNLDLSTVKIYEDVYNSRSDILKENKGKSGIYMLTNKLTGDVYIGQSFDISKRLNIYLNLSHIKCKATFILSRALIKYGYSNFSLTILEYCDKSDLSVREQYYFDKLNPEYNILKTAASSKGYKHLEDTKIKISKYLKGVYSGEKFALFGRNPSEETNQKMNLKKAGVLNPNYGKTQSELSKELMRLKALEIKHSDETKLKMSTKHGNPVNIYEKCSAEGLKLIGSFVSTKRAAKFLGISGSTVVRYMQSGEIFKERYKFSTK